MDAHPLHNTQACSMHPQFPHEPQQTASRCWQRPSPGLERPQGIWRFPYRPHLPTPLAHWQQAKRYLRHLMLSLCPCLHCHRSKESLRSSSLPPLPSVGEADPRQRTRWGESKAAVCSSTAPPKRGAPGSCLAEGTPFFSNSAFCRQTLSITSTRWCESSRLWCLKHTLQKPSSNLWSTMALHSCRSSVGRAYPFNPCSCTSRVLEGR